MDIPIIPKTWELQFFTFYNVNNCQFVVNIVNSTTFTGYISLLRDHIKMANTVKLMMTGWFHSFINYLKLAWRDRNNIYSLMKFENRNNISDWVFVDVLKAEEIFRCQIFLSSCKKSFCYRNSLVSWRCKN